LGRDGYVPSKAEVIFDLAAYGNMAGHRGDPGEIYSANLMRVIDSVGNLSENQKFLYVSTSSVMLPIKTPYSLSKKAAEEYLKHSGKRIAIARPFSITGVGDQEDHLIPTLIRSCLYNLEMPFVEEPVHDFLDVNDFVDALLTIREKAQFAGEVYEIGSGQQHTNQEVRERVEFYTGSKANVKIVDSMRKYDSKVWVSNNERISTLGWSPSRTLSDSIEEMVKHERENN
jgi:nucleoside-diphosphate-sugar epimerase